MFFIDNTYSQPTENFMTSPKFPKNGVSLGPDIGWSFRYRYGL